MDKAGLLEKIKSQKIGKAPVVVLPLRVWAEILDQLEELEMMQSKSLRGKITRARSEKKLYSPSQAKKILGI